MASQNVTDLERLIAIEDIRRLKARYARYADTKQWAVLAELFLPDGTFTPYTLEGAVWMQMRGREEIASKISASVGSASAIHHLFSHEIDILSPSSARSIWAMEDWVIRPDHEKLVRDPVSGVEPFRTMHGYGHYHGTYRKVDGEWLIAELKQTRVKMDFTY